jgi:hypothetical protein
VKLTIHMRVLPRLTMGTAILLLQAWVGGHSLAGIAGSNPARGVDVCLL